MQEELRMKQANSGLVVLMLCSVVMHDAAATWWREREIARAVKAVGLVTGIGVVALCKLSDCCMADYHGVAEGMAASFFAMWATDYLLGHQSPERIDREARLWEQKLARDTRLQLSAGDDEIIDKLMHEQAHRVGTIPLCNVIRDLKKMRDGADVASMNLMELRVKGGTSISQMTLHERLMTLSNQGRNLNRLINTIETSKAYQ